MSVGFVLSFFLNLTLSVACFYILEARDNISNKRFRRTMRKCDRLIKRKEEEKRKAEIEFYTFIWNFCHEEDEEIIEEDLEMQDIE